MKTHNINLNNSVANNFMAEIRDIEVQGDRQRFRNNLKRIGAILAYEMSKSLDYHDKIITTPLSDITQKVLKDQPMLISIMRAGMPFFDGVLEFFDQSDAGFIGAYRTNNFATSKEISVNYLAVGDITDKIVVIADPMLATGKSIVDSIENLRTSGVPKKIFILAVIAAPEGIKYLEENVGLPIELWCAAIDDKLDEKSYIVPGLGDAGDLSYGLKS